MVIALGIAKKNHMTQFIYRNLKLLRLGIIVVDEDNLIVRKGEEEIYMMFEATPSSSCMDIRLAHRGVNCRAECSSRLYLYVFHGRV